MTGAKLTAIAEGAEPERIGGWLAERLHDEAWRRCTVIGAAVDGNVELAWGETR